MRENQIFIGYIQVTLYFLNVYCLILYNVYVCTNTFREGFLFNFKFHNISFAIFLGLLVSLAALLWTNNQPRV